MTQYRGAQWAMSAPASSYGAAATIDRLMPYTDDISVDWVPNDQTSDVLTSGPLVSSTAPYRPTESASGSYPFEVKSKGFGRLFKGALGAATSTLVSTGLYQQNHTLGTGNTLDDFNLQAVRLQYDGTEEVHTYLGAVITSLELKMDNAGVLTGTAEFDARTMVTNVAKASLSSVAANRFTFAGFSVFTGTITEPTATALATAATPVDGVKSLDLKIERTMVVDDFRANNTGLKSQPVVGDVTKVTGEMQADYTSQIATLFRAGWQANTGIPLLYNFVNGTDQIQIAAGYCRVTDPVTPNIDGKQPVVDLKFEALSSAAYTQPLWLVARTADTAL